MYKCVGTSQGEKEEKKTPDKGTDVLPFMKETRPRGESTSLALWLDATTWCSIASGERPEIGL
jgi:hypothetical protein